MRYFEIAFDYKTRAWFRKSQVKTRTICVAARDITEAYRIAKLDGTLHFHRQYWRVVNVQEIAAPQQ